MTSMSSALQTALSGLQVTQSGIGVVSNNVANAGSAGYTRQTQTTVPILANGEVVGARAQAIGRSLDTLLQRQVWTEAAGGAYTATTAGYAQSVDTLFGSPGGAGSLDTVFNAFTTAVQSLTSTPNDQAAQGTVLNKAKLLANQLNTVSDGIQTQRSNAELELSTAVDSANQVLSAIQTASNQLNQQGSNASAALLDQRDAAISTLAGLMDVKVTKGEGNTLSIFTSGGAMLFDGKAAKLSFDSHAPLEAGAAYSTDPARRDVGTVTLTSENGASTDLVASKAIRSGTIGALLDLRDTGLVQAQAQVDGIAAAMAQALSDAPVPSAATGTAPTVTQSIDLSSLKAGNTVALTVNDGGTLRKFLLVKVASAGTDVSAAAGGLAGVTAIAFTDAASAAAALTTATGAPLASHFTASASGSTLSLVNSAAGSAVTSLSGRATTTGLSSGTTDNLTLPLFTDANDKPYTGAFDGGAQLTGFAARIQVNSQVTADTSTLIKYNAGAGDSDSLRPTFIAGALTQTQMTLAPSTGIGGTAAPFKGSVGEIVRQVINQQASNAAQAKSLDSGQQMVVNALADRQKTTSGVSIDTEMTSLIQLQNAYSANARVMSAVKDMMQLLMNL